MNTGPKTCYIRRVEGAPRPQSSTLLFIMNRQQVIAKIQSILKLQNGTDFEGEASAAAAMIDKLCKQYEVTVSEATETQVHDESFESFKRVNQAYATLLNAVASFYDAKAYLKNGETKSLQVIGSEGQQIQVRLYFDYLLQVMEREAETAHKAEKVLAELTGGTVSRSFKLNFRKAFSDKVALRLSDMKKEENRVHDDAEAVSNKLSKMRFGRAKKFTGANGAGATVGANVGAGVSLHRQANGSTQRQLCGV
jgi:enamine deaminase RidA (YjgF/YER057c/UK114 family)